MSNRMQVNRLLQDELAYELQIRGIATGTVEEMRHSLAMQLRLEKTGDSIKYPSYPFSVEEDIDAVEKKLTELEPLISDFKNNTSSASFMKLQSRLSHVMNRIDHIEPDGSGAKRRAEFLARTLFLMDSLQNNAEKFMRDQQSPQPKDVDQQDMSTFPEPVRRSSAFNDVRRGSSDNFKSILPNKWNLKFSGDKKGLSLNAFLERCEELRVARHVSKDILLQSGIDLFEGRAYQFYLAYRDEVSTWDEFIVLLREEYLSSTYDEQLLDEIKKRTQGNDESVGIYLAVMTGYFKRLSTPISEKEKLKIILRNISPFYQNHLALVEVNSIGNLRELCRRLEDRKQAVENFIPPNRKNSTLEPDLAYVTVKNADVDAVVSTSNLNEGANVICYRCRKPGHKAIGCATTGGKFCFRCRKEGYTIKTCPNCCREGNELRRA